MLANLLLADIHFSMDFVIETNFIEKVTLLVLFFIKKGNTVAGAF